MVSNPIPSHLLFKTDDYRITLDDFSRILEAQMSDKDKDEKETPEGFPEIAVAGALAAAVVMLEDVGAVTVATMATAAGVATVSVSLPAIVAVAAVLPLGISLGKKIAKKIREHEDEDDDESDELDPASSPDA
jgi:hypothetical protein